MLAPLPHDEENRLKELLCCGLLDTPPDPACDRLTRLAAKVFKAPIALIVLVDRERQWFKSRHGLELEETDRGDAFCAYTILEKRAMVIRDVRADKRFAGNRLVIGKPHLRFYAGVPLSTPSGQRIGTICIMDTVPRPGFGEHEIAILEDLATMAVEEMELRSTSERSQLELDQRERADKILRIAHDEMELRVQQRTADLTQTNAALLVAEAKYRGIFENAIEGIFQTLPDGTLLNANPALARLLGYETPQSMIEAVGNFSSLYVSDSRRAEFQKEVEAAGFVVGFESEARRGDGASIWISENARAVHDADGRLLHYEGTIEDVSSRRAAEQTLAQAREDLESRVRVRTAELALVNGNLRLLLQERELADATLRSSEAKFRAMIENAQDLITILDPQGIMLYQSPSVEYIFGFRPEDLVGRSMFEYVHPDDHACVRERMAAVFNGQNHILCEARLRRRDGSWRLIESVGSLTPPDSPVAGLVINSRDITERRRTEALHEARTRQQTAIAELSHHALQGLDLPTMFDKAVALASATLSVKVVAISEFLPAGDRLVIRSGCGFLPGIVGQAEVESWRHTRGHAPEDQGPVVVEDFGDEHDCRLLVADALAEQPDSAVSVLIQAPGRRYGTLCALSSIARRFSEEDVTFLQTMADLLSTAIVRRRNEEALRVVEARYHRIVANTPGMVFQFMIRSDRSTAMLFVSAECQVIYGMEPQAFYDRPDLLWTMAHPDDRVRLIEAGRRAQARLEPFAWEGRVVLASGELIDVSIRGRPERLANGDTIWDGVVVDVSELKRAQAAMQAAKEEAERANNAKSEFLSRISHELRTPLNAILGFGQLLEMDRLTASQKCSVEQILRGGRHLLQLINEVLDIARIESGNVEFKMEPVRLSELVSSTILLVEPLAEPRGIRFEVHALLDCRLNVLADRARLTQVLLNLLSNAIKYNRDHGRVSLHCEEREGGCVRLSVTDTGPGLTVGEVARLFTPFERLDAPRRGVEGTGIGLAISRSLIEAMDGSLGVDSGPGLGCTFFVDLPAVPGHWAVEQAPVARAAEPLPPPSQISRRRTVLHIEDQRANRELVELALLSRPQVRLLESMDGESGFMRARIGQPDLILLDLHLPDIDGEEVLRRLRAEPLTAHIPVIVVSADATPSRREQLRPLGVDTYLTKPLHVAQFLHVLDEALALVGS